MSGVRAGKNLAKLTTFRCQRSARDERQIVAKLRAIGAGRGIEVRVAYDGMKMTL
jgi:hypothetical protein